MMPLPLTRVRAAALLTCLGLLGQGLQGEAFAQAAKKPAAPAAAPAPSAPAPAGQPPAAAGQPQQGSMRVDMQPAQVDWTKVCGKDQSNGREICYTTRDFVNGPEQAPPIAVAIYDVKGEDTRVVRLLLPVALLLKPGFRFAVDKGPAQDGAFEICMPNGCFAEAKVKAATIDAMKKGTVLNVVVKNSANNELTFGLPMSGFGKAFDGAPIDPKVLQAQQEELQKQLEAKAKAERQKLETQQGAATPAPAATPPAATPAQ